MSDYSAFIPFVNRPELLRKAVDSIADLHPMVIDNAADDSTGRLYWNYRPPVPLSCPQVFNFIMRKTRDSGGNICIWMHNDAEAHPGVGAELLNQARLFNAQRRKWGVLFTNYDTLSALNTDMMEDVGDWDTVFTQYFCDNDYYRRVRLAGWETICTDLKVEHVGSQTIHSDPALMNRNRATFLLYRDYYARKWGGEPGSETFNAPWGGE